MSLLPDISDAMAGSQIPLFAAVSIANGRGVAAALGLGASRGVMGTRFLAAKEVRIGWGYRGEILRASDGAASTTHALRYTHLRCTLSILVDRTFTKQQEGNPFEEQKKLYDEASKAEDNGWGPDWRHATYAGASIGLIHDVKDAGAVVRGVKADYSESIHMLMCSYQDGIYKDTPLSN